MTDVWPLQLEIFVGYKLRIEILDIPQIVLNCRYGIEKPKNV